MLLLLRVTATSVARALQPEYSRAPICASEPGGGESEPGVEGTVAKEDRGFASMDRSKQREIASKGGKAAHQKGTAHEWTSEEAREAGRKGGMASHRRKQEQGSPLAETQGQSHEQIAASASDSESMIGRGDES